MSESLSSFAQPNALATPEERPHWTYTPEVYAETRFVAFPKGFIEMRNPLNRVQSALVHLGPPPGTAPPAYVPNLSDPDEDEAPTDRQRRVALAKQQRECCKIIFAPGETKLVPRELVRALVTVRNGVVVGGLLPFLQIPGDPRPPELGPAFLAPDPFEAP